MGSCLLFCSEIIFYNWTEIWVSHLALEKMKFTLKGFLIASEDISLEKRLLQLSSRDQIEQTPLSVLERSQDS